MKLSHQDYNRLRHMVLPAMRDLPPTQHYLNTGKDYRRHRLDALWLARRRYKGQMREWFDSLFVGGAKDRAIDAALRRIQVEFLYGPKNHKSR